MRPATNHHHTGRGRLRCAQSRCDGDGKVATFTIAGGLAPNGAVGDQPLFSIRTSEDTMPQTTTAEQTYQIDDTVNSFTATSGQLTTGMVPTSITFGFTPSDPNGGLLAGAEISILASEPIYDANQTPAIALAGGFGSSCNGAGATGASGRMLVVTLSGICVLGVTSGTTFTVMNAGDAADADSGLQPNPLAGPVTFSIQTSSDTGWLAAQAGYVVTDGAVTWGGADVTPPSDSGSIVTGGTPQDMAFTATTSDSGALQGTSFAESSDRLYIVASEAVFLSSDAPTISCGAVDMVLRTGAKATARP